MAASLSQEKASHSYSLLPWFSNTAMDKGFNSWCSQGLNREMASNKDVS